MQTVLLRDCGLFLRATAQNLLTVTPWFAVLMSCSTEAFLCWLSNAAAGQIRRLCFCSVFSYKVSYTINKFYGCKNETKIIFNWTAHSTCNSTSEFFFFNSKISQTTLSDSSKEKDKQNLQEGKNILSFFLERLHPWLLPWGYLLFHNTQQIFDFWLLQFPFLCSFQPFASYVQVK